MLTSKSWDLYTEYPETREVETENCYTGGKSCATCMYCVGMYDSHAGECVVRKCTAQKTAQKKNK